jgi:hypothetical protein
MLLRGACLWLSVAICAFAQRPRGELRLEVHDAAGGALKAAVELVNE